MELLGGALAAFVAAALLVLTPAPLRWRALRYAAFYAAVTGPLTVVAPVVTRWVRHGLADTSRAVPTLEDAARGLVGFVLLRGGVALLEGLLLARVSGVLPSRSLVAALACAAAVLAEVLLRLDDILTVARMFPLIAVADLLAPEVAPALLGAAATALWVTRSRDA